MRDQKRKQYNPPFIGDKLLRIFVSGSQKEDLSGDFLEIYSDNREEKGRFSAWILYWMQLLAYLPEFISNLLYWEIQMIFNYLKTALRNIRKNRIYSLITISGMAISIAACFLILKYVGFELSFDRFHKNADNLYRLINDRYQNGELIQHGVITYPSVPKAMCKDYPEIINYTRMYQSGRIYLRRDDVGFEETYIYADEAFFSMFSFHLISGDPDEVLSEPYSILLSESYAEKYFGSDWRTEGVSGKVLTVDNNFNLTVTGVFEDIPANSHITFNILVSFKTIAPIEGDNFEDSWTYSDFYVYLQLASGTNKKVLDQKFINFSERYFNGTEVTNSLEKFYLQPLKDIHLYSDYEYDNAVSGNITVIIALLLTVGFILIIAWLNYINLSTAKSIDRIKEIGVRKAVGAQKIQIIKQFLFESLLLNGIGIIIAVVVVSLVQSTFRDVLNIQFSQTIFTGSFGIAFFIIVLIGTVLTGLYPAFITSSYKSNSALTGKFKKSTSGRLIIKWMVIFQFALSFALIAGTYAVYLQINYMMNQDLGVDIKRTIVVRSPRLTRWGSSFYDNIFNFKKELTGYPEISNVTTSGRLLGIRTARIFNIRKQSGDSQQRFTTGFNSIDYDFFDTFDLDILAGRKFGRSDHNFEFNSVQSIIINKSASRLLGFERFEDALNQKLNFWNRDWEIIGIAENHHQQSLHVPVEPIIFAPLFSTGNSFYIKVNSREIPATIAKIKNKYLEFFPGNSFSHFFLDDFFNGQYQADRNFRNIFSFFTFLCISLTCLGLFGQSYYTITQKTKEIGIRKVLGASTGSIYRLIIKYFLKLIFLGTLFAAPFTYYLINRWLSDYAYRINFNWTMLVIPGILIFVTALITVSYKTIKAAFINPVEPLKHE